MRGGVTPLPEYGMYSTLYHQSHNLCFLMHTVLEHKHPYICAACMHKHEYIHVHTHCEYIHVHMNTTYPGTGIMAKAKHNTCPHILAYYGSV